MPATYTLPLHGMWAIYHFTSEASIFNGLKAFLYFTYLLAKVVKVAWLLGFNVLVSILLD